MIIQYQSNIIRIIYNNQLEIIDLLYQIFIPIAVEIKISVVIIIKINNNKLIHLDINQINYHKHNYKVEK